jgi:hypothetical protein
MLDNIIRFPTPSPVLLGTSAAAKGTSNESLGGNVVRLKFRVARDPRPLLAVALNQTALALIVQREAWLIWWMVVTGGMVGAWCPGGAGGPLSRDEGGPHVYQ